MTENLRHTLGQLKADRLLITSEVTTSHEGKELLNIQIDGNHLTYYSLSELRGRLIENLRTTGMGFNLSVFYAGFS